MQQLFNGVFAECIINNTWLNRTLIGEIRRVI